jgi:hypothetical protein
MLAYLLDDGSELGTTPLPCCSHSPARDVAGCPSCHQGGLLPVTDMVRPYVEANLSLFPGEILPFVQQAYPPPAELDALIESDSQLHRAASERAGVLSNGPDPLSYVYQQFEQEALSLPRVAAELGVTADELRAQLPLLDPRLGGLPEALGTVTRNRLEQVYLDSSCILHAAARNRPVSCP